MIKWYTCGQTIYGKSHMGHAKTFVVFDVMKHYFESKGKNIYYVMNITDVNDKIVKRVKHEKVKRYIKKFEKMYGREKIMNSLVETIYPDNYDKVIDDPQNRELLEKWLINNRLKIGKHISIEPTMKEYNEFISKMETTFWNDLKSIGVDKPDTITRVSENIPNIIAYIKKIIDNGYAYESNGSVYFDSIQFIKDGYDFSPMKVETDDFTIKDAHNLEKKSPKDFALWKTNKGTISYTSPSE